MFRYLIYSPPPFNQIHIKKFIIPTGGCLENRNDCLASLQFSSQNLPLSLERVVYMHNMHTCVVLCLLSKSKPDETNKH